jgi:DNA replication protein DnaC
VRVGKTGLLAAALKELVNRHFASVFYITVGDFCDHIGEAWVEHKGEKHNLVRVMREAEVLFLDEVGVGHTKVSEMSDSTPLGNLFKVIDGRYRQGKPVLIATNCEAPTDLLEVLGERIFNRLYETCKSLLCVGKNLR